MKRLTELFYLDAQQQLATPMLNLSHYRETHTIRQKWIKVIQKNESLLSPSIMSKKLTSGSIFSLWLIHLCAHSTAADWKPYSKQQSHAAFLPTAPVRTPATFIQSLRVLWQVIAVCMGRTLKSRLLLLDEEVGLIITNLTEITIWACVSPSYLWWQGASSAPSRQRRPSHLITRQQWHGNRHATSPGGPECNIFLLSIHPVIHNTPVEFWSHFN